MYATLQGGQLPGNHVQQSLMVPAAEPHGPCSGQMLGQMKKLLFCSVQHS